MVVCGLLFLVKLLKIVKSHVQDSSFNLLLLETHVITLYGSYTHLQCT